MKFIKTGKWAYSYDGEDFYDGGFNTKEKVVDFIKNEYGDGYIGQCVSVEFDENDINYELSYQLEKALFDAIGDSAKLWKLSSEDEKTILQKMGQVMANALTEMHLQPNGLFKVINIEKISPVDKS